MPQTGLCGRCLREPPAFDGALAAFLYRFPADRLVQRFKFGADLATGRWLARQLAQRAAAGDKPALLVAPPLAPERLSSRGFNQALELAKGVGIALGMPVDPWAMRRTRATPPQPGLGARERRRNLRDAFVACTSLEGRHVAIIDDVMTTGATADALARAAKARGAARVSVWVAARTPEPRR